MYRLLAEIEGSILECVRGRQQENLQTALDPHTGLALSDPGHFASVDRPADTVFWTSKMLVLPVN